MTSLHEPIHRSNKTTEREKGCFAFFTWMFILGAIILLGIMVFSENDNVRILCIVGAVIFGALALFVNWFSKVGQDVEKHFELNETGIHEYAINHKTGKKAEYHLLFEDIDKVLIGNYVNHIEYPSGQGIDFNRFGALIIIMSGEELYFERVMEMDLFNEWVVRLMDKQCPLYFTEYNLSPALGERSTHYVDFRKIVGVPWNDVTEPPPVGQESRRNPFLNWEHGGELKDPTENETKEHAKKAEKITAISLFVYALFAGAVILPGMPLDGEGAYKDNNLILLGVTLVNVLVPSILVYWRKFTKWYLPFKHLLTVTIGNSLALLMISSLTNDAFVFEPILILNLTNLLIGWYPALFAIKIIRVVFTTLHKINS